MGWGFCFRLVGLVKSWPTVLELRVEDSDVYDSGSGVGGAKAATRFKV